MKFSDAFRAVSFEGDLYSVNEIDGGVALVTDKGNYKKTLSRDEARRLEGVLSEKTNAYRWYESQGYLDPESPHHDSMVNLESEIKALLESLRIAKEGAEGALELIEILDSEDFEIELVPYG